MGLQRIFSATTVVVGLFISVDYGLCDEFRCRGTDLTDQIVLSTFADIAGNNNDDPNAIPGWKGRVMWTLLYILGIAFWSLHIALLEAYLIFPTEVNFHRTYARLHLNNSRLDLFQDKQQCSLKSVGLLKTVSRMVATSEPALPHVVPTNATTKVPCDKGEPEAELNQERGTSDDSKTHPLHILVWLHLFSLGFIALFGWIDIFPVSGPTKSLSRHWSDTENTIMCHFDVYPKVPEVRSYQPNTDRFMDSASAGHYNDTAQGLPHRSRRSLTAATERSASHRLEIHFNYTTHHSDDQATKSSHASSSGQNRINMRRAPVASEPGHGVRPKWHLAANNSERGQESKGARLLVRPETGNCGRAQIYSLLLLLVYIVFVASLVNFLLISESAVFTVSMLTAALPLTGIFWAMFEITVEAQTIVLIWSPEISGELICSLLGTPIVFLGIGLLCRAYFNEQLALFNSPAGCDVVCFDNRNYFTTCFETGCSTANYVTVDETLEHPTKDKGNQF